MPAAIASVSSMNVVVLWCPDDTASSLCYSLPIFHMVPEPRGEGVLYRCSIHLWLSTPQTLSVLWPVLNFHINRWWDQRSILSCVYSDINIERSLTLYPFSRIIVQFSPLGPVSSQLWVLCHILSTHHVFLLGGWALNLIRKWSPP